MSLINVILAIDVPVANQLRSNFVRNENGQRQALDLTDEQEHSLRAHFTGFWNNPDLVGPPDVIYSWYMPDTLNETEDGLQAVDDLKAISNWVTKIEVLGAWNNDGIQFGQTVTPAVWDYSDPQNPVLVTPEQVTGTPIYPIHAAYMSIMPDDVTYDADGNEVSRTPAAAPKDVNLMLGQSPRRWV